MPAKVRTFDFGLAIAPIFLTIVGVSVIYSLVLGTSNDGLATKQAIIGLVGIVFMLIASFSDYRFFRGTAWIWYILSLVLLLLVNFHGKTTNGAENWLDLKFFQLQPSELAKIFLIISLSAYFSSSVGKVTWKKIFGSLLILLPPLILVLKEPDLGTALVLAFSYVVILLLTKLDRSKIYVLVGLVAAGLVLVVLAYNNIAPFGRLLADYQRARIAVFLHPDLDPYGRGYNITQAKITVGSGGIIGKGLGKGTQSQLQFLPEPHTDFIFAGIAESYGFLGSFALIAIYSYFLLRLIDIGASARDNFGMFISFGVASMFFVQLIISVGMNLGLLPVTGIPLPFLSYGGTSLLASFLAVGLAQSIYTRHKKISF